MVEFNKKFGVNAEHIPGYDRCGECYNPDWSRLDSCECGGLIHVEKTAGGFRKVCDGTCGKDIIDG